jgi:hypothetical protein
VLTAGSKRFLSLASEAISIEDRWKESTAKLLDREVVPLGSFDSLRWHLAETMIVHWAEEQGVQGLHNCFQIIDRLVDEAAENPESKFKMDIYLIHAVLKSWNRHFRKFQVDLLPSQVLEKIDTFLSKAKDCFVPNIVTYTMILDGATHCPNPAERLVFTEDLLGRLMEESKTNPLVRPTVVTFGTVIKAWAKSGSASVAEKAEALLRHMQELDQNNKEWQGVQPNARLYTSVIQGWANAGAPERAEILLKQMYEEYRLHGNSDVKPNIWSFNSVLSAWTKSPSPQAFESSEKLLRNMTELYENDVLDILPDVVSYNCVLQTLAKRRGDPEAVAKAESLMEEMVKIGSRKPNIITYVALFRILAGSNAPDRADKAKTWLEKSKEQGVSEDRFLLDQYHTMTQQCEGTLRNEQDPGTGGHNR